MIYTFLYGSPGCLPDSVDPPSFEPDESLPIMPQVLDFARDELIAVFGDDDAWMIEEALDEIERDRDRAASLDPDAGLVYQINGEWARAHVVRDFEAERIRREHPSPLTSKDYR